ncbi:hypothetical protein EU538_07595 [Candidatus Thorarchaeota archaeon]|nr:MAG: hypothetical protein EU538_07595 [Candidatus Thorarchaeota archaeon]
MVVVTERKRLGIGGPLMLGFGGVFIILPVLGFFQLLFDGRLTWPNDEAYPGILAFIGAFVFLGFCMLGLGIEVINEDSR